MQHYLTTEPPNSKEEGDGSTLLQRDATKSHRSSVSGALKKELDHSSFTPAGLLVGYLSVDSCIAGAGPGMERQFRVG